MNLNKKIIIGTANFDYKYKLASNKNVNLKKINSILSYCYRNKFDFFDTAQSYNTAERILGKFILSKKSNFKIITKLNKDDKINEENLYKSIEILNIKPWCLLCHDHNQYLNKRNVEKLLLLKQKKLIKYFGVSVYNQKQIDDVLKVYKPDILQIPINILDQRLLKNNYLFDIKNNNIQIHARSVFLRGLLFYDHMQIIKIFPSIQNEIFKFNNFIKHRNISLSQLSLIWVNSIKEIDKIILGVTSDTELIQNLEILSKNKIDDSTRIKLNININDENILDPSKWKIKF